VSTLPEVREAHPGVERQRDDSAPRHLENVSPTLDAGRAGWRGRAIALAPRLRYPLAVYALARLLYLLVALADLLNKPHWSLGHELRNWDGKWYVATAAHGYFPYVYHGQSTLGFLPLYPALMWLVAHALFCGYVVAGVLISLVTGALATVLIYRLATEWWGEAAARRGILFFCLFPGTIVFSMVYSEGLMLTLVAGSLLALERRRWVAAGLLAGLSTAVAPVAVAMIPACAVVAVREIRRRGRHDRQGWRALWAPILSPLGLVAFGVFLWLWTGSPMASFTAQHDGWQEHSSPLALYWTAHHLFEELAHLGPIDQLGINLNNVAGLLGAVFLAYGLVLLWRHRTRVPLAATVYTAGVALLTVTSDQTPPNPRMLLCAFPVLLVYAVDFDRRGGRAFRRLMVGAVGLLFVMSWISFVGTGLRP
jgi:hypothetical protein